jgi:hypothetical protein
MIKMSEEKYNSFFCLEKAQIPSFIALFNLEILIKLTDVKMASPGDLGTPLLRSNLGHLE